MFLVHRHYVHSTIQNVKNLINKSTRLLVFLSTSTKDFGKILINNQQYFWVIYQQSTSKIMAKSTINKKVCTLYCHFIIIDLYFKCNMASNIDLARSCVV